MLDVRIVRLVVHLIAAIADGVPPAAVEAFQLVGIDSEIVGFEMVVFTNQLALGFTKLRAVVIGRRVRAHWILLCYCWPSNLEILV